MRLASRRPIAHASLALAPLLVFISLLSAALFLQSCAPRSYVRVGSFAGIPDGQTARIAGVSDSEAFWWELDGTSDVQSVTFDEVNGTALDAPSRVEVTAGEVTIVCSVKGYVDGGLDPWLSKGRATFVAEPGATYSVAPRKSEHQWPWSLRVHRTSDGEIVASSEPTFADVAPSPRPAFARDWQAIEWFAYADMQTARFAPSAEAKEEWLFSRSQIAEGVSAPDVRVLAEQSLRQGAESFELVTSNADSFTARGVRAIADGRMRFLMQWKREDKTVEVTTYIAPADSAHPERFRAQ